MTPTHDDTPDWRGIWLPVVTFLVFAVLALAHYFPRAGPADRPDSALSMDDMSIEKPAMALPQSDRLLQYPRALREANVEGRVVAEFVVDVRGRADMSTYRELESSHELFSEAVRSHLPAMRFSPAEEGGRKVRMWVQMPFNFVITR